MDVFRAFRVWLLMMAAESTLGVLRGLFLAPAIGDRAARQVGFFVGLVVIGSIAWLLIRWIAAATPASARQSGRNVRVGRWLVIGLMWATLTLGFELAIGRAMGRPWDRIAQDYDVAHGGLMPFGLAFMLACPLLAARLRLPDRRS